MHVFAIAPAEWHNVTFESHLNIDFMFKQLPQNCICSNLRNILYLIKVVCTSVAKPNPSTLSLSAIRYYYSESRLTLKV